MVEIKEESSERHGPSESSGPSQSSGSTGPSPSNTAPPVTVIDYVKSRPTDVALFLTRLITIFCSLYYALPFGAPASQNTAYVRAFFAAAATNALRLHQRVGDIQFSREFFTRLIAEDACHYLLYSLLFINATPVTMAVMPVFLFAIMHAANFIVQMCSATGHGSSPMVRKLQQFTADQTQNILGIIACSEIFMMPLLIIMIFTGKGSIFLPFIYYRFLVFRYTSRRNQTTRIVFYQLRVAVENAVASQNCPQMIRSAAHSIIGFISRLCPAQA